MALETLVALERLEALSRKRPWPERLKALALNFLRRCLPWLELAPECPFCWAQLELVDDRIVGDYGALITNMRTWKCPRCGRGTSEHHTYYLLGPDL